MNMILEMKKLAHSNTVIILHLPDANFLKLWYAYTYDIFALLIDHALGLCQK